MKHQPSKAEKSAKYPRDFASEFSGFREVQEHSYVGQSSGIRMFAGISRVRRTEKFRGASCAVVRRKSHVCFYEAPTEQSRKERKVPSGTLQEEVFICYQIING